MSDLTLEQAQPTPHQSQEIDDTLLTREQREAIDRAVAWARDPNSKQILTLGGRAGTGKTTIVKKITKQLTTDKKRTVVGAYTGKAVAQLRRKAITSAQTLHSMIYKLDGQDPKTGRLLFTKSQFAPGDLAIIDEASMIDYLVDGDLRSYKMKILYIGDHWQLEPIGQSDPGLMRNPEIRLEQIHRQAENSEIVQFATHLHYGATYPGGRYIFQPRYSDELEVGNTQRFWVAAREADIALVGKNTTRHTTNQMIRRHRGFEGPTPQIGERIICLRNNREYGVYNGMILTVTALRGTDGNVLLVDTEDELGNTRQYLPALISQFGQDSMAGEASWEYLLFDFGYALTVHKAQGSEWDTVAVLEETFPSLDLTRWQYTAATRAAKKLIYCR